MSDASAKNPWCAFGWHSPLSYSGPRADGSLVVCCERCGRANVLHNGLYGWDEVQRYCRPSQPAAQPRAAAREEPPRPDPSITIGTTTVGVDGGDRWKGELFIAAVVIAICAAFLVGVVVAKADAHRDSTSVNGPTLHAPAFTPFAVNTAKGTGCPAVHGEALCVPGPQGKAALKAFAAWPTVATLRNALGKAKTAQDATAKLADEERKVRAARELEIVALRAALEAEKRRAGSLQKALDGSWWRSLLNYVVVPAGALGAGFAAGRWAR